MSHLMKMKPSHLILQDGSIFEGYSPSWQNSIFLGEVVFNTGMTGYCESLTDPSYAGQILVFTYPLIGNYGIPDRSHWESKRIHARGVIVSEHCANWSHYGSHLSLLEWLHHEKVPILTGIDTRRLTINLRSHGVKLGLINCTDTAVDHEFYDPNKEHLVSQVSTQKKQIYQKIEAKKKIIVVDCGMKENILRSLRQFPLEIHQVPYNEDYSEEDFDGVFLSNGPGDPQVCRETISVLKKAMKKSRPIFGICLGAQIMALAAGANTYKLQFGHRGHNQPCMETRTRRCYITSQNHGYAIDPDSLPSDWEVSFTNLNDGSVEGIRHRHLPYYAVQFHPEAAPGPTDTKWLFNQFYQSLSHDNASI